VPGAPSRMTPVGLDRITLIALAGSERRRSPTGARARGPEGSLRPRGEVPIEAARVATTAADLSATVPAC
jgi:hypothetical protein